MTTRRTAEHQKRPGADPLVEEEAFDRQLDADDDTEEEGEQTGDAEEVHRPLPVVGEKDDRQEIEETLDETLVAVFGLTPGAGVVLDREFGDAEALGVGEDGSEAVELAVEADLTG